MSCWKLEVAEPSLDELIGDEMMAAVTRSAGLDRRALRELMMALARRMPARPGSRMVDPGVF